MLLILFYPFDSLAQTAVARIWSDTFGVQDTALKTPVISDAFLNTFIAGTEYNQTTGVDILLRKLDEHGDLLWQTSYTNSGAYRDQATDIALDDSGNVYLCGTSYISGNHYDFLVLKFDSTGTLLWDYTMNGSASQGDGASALFIDSGSVFVTGPMTNTGSYVDYRTIRLSAAGVLQWQSTYNFVNLADVPFDITVSDGNVFVTGGSQNNISDWDYASIQLLSHNGVPVDTSRTGGTGIGFDHAAEAIADDAGDYYVTGTFQNNGNKDFRTIKFDAGLNVLWSESFDWDNEDDEAFSLTVDPFGNVYVAGTSRDSSNAQFTIVKYDSTGTQQWIHRSGGLHHNKAARITCDDLGNVYATGERHNGFHADFYTLALDSTGTELWYKLFNGASNGNDRANMILVKDEYILVSGTSVINGTEQYITIAYGTYRLELPPDTGSTTSDSPNFFYPQLGQILDDTSGTADVQYYTLHHGPALFLKDEQLSFVWARTDTSASTQDTLQRIDQVVFNASETRLYEYKESESYLNYYLPHCSSGITNVHGYKWLSIPEVYRNVNLYYTFNQAGLKQMFVSKPGTKPTIELKYNGADTLLVDTADGSLEIIGAISSFKFSRPYAYELDAQGNIIPGTLFYPVYNQTSSGIILMDNISYNVGNALVVVMERVYVAPLNVENLFWSSYFGGSGLDHNFSVISDGYNRSSYVGSSSSPVFPSPDPNLSAKTVHEQNLDAFLASFDENAVLKYFTYFGGSTNDYFFDITFTGNGNLVAVGKTNSNDITNYKPDGINFSTYNGGSSDGIIAFFQNSYPYASSDGELLVDSYFGGSGEDALTCVSLCQNINHIVIGGYSTDESNLPLTALSGASGNHYYQGTLGGGNNRDGLIIELDDDYNLIWATLFGGDGDDFVSDISGHVEGELYITGGSNTDNNSSVTNCSVPNDGGFPDCQPDPVNYPGVYYQNDNNGGYDCFLARFTDEASRNLSWSTFLGGAGDEPNSSAVQTIFGYGKIAFSVDEFGPNKTIGLVGSTGSDDVFDQYPSTDFLPFNQAFCGGASDGFFIRFVDMIPDYATYYGSGGNDALTDVAYKTNGNINVFGGIAQGDVLSVNCTANGFGRFTICNGSGVVYMESFSVPSTASHFKSCIGSLTPKGRLTWSTRFGSQTGKNILTGISINGNAMFSSGVTFDQESFTLQDYSSSPTDYFFSQPLGDLSDGTVSRFDVTNIAAWTGTNETTSNSNTVEINPNPTNTLSTIISYNQILAIRCFEMYGRILHPLIIINQNLATVDWSNSPEGVYFIEIQTATSRVVQKVIVTK